MQKYKEFLADKAQLGGRYGFEAETLPEWLFPFQRDLVAWSIEKGRGAIFADCGLGKTPMALAWAECVSRKEGKPVLIGTPLAVGHQFVREAAKFGIDCNRSRDGSPGDAPVVVTNYEKLHLFDPKDFSGMVCDESSILKNFDGKRRALVSEFLRTLPFRLLCTATAAPNDYIELGTSSEALGEMGHMDMLGRFFRNEQNNSATGRQWGSVSKWRFKGHAEDNFWRWVCSWARAVRSPSDMGYDDGEFVLPPLNEVEHIVEARTLRAGSLFSLPAQNLQEEREERRRTITERCERAAELVDHGEQSLVWCHLNAESDLMTKLIPDGVQVTGSDSDDAKEERLLAFQSGEIRVLVTKPRIGAWGLNLQGCAHVVTFPSHSYEQYYQSVRRCWRFGQQRPVRVDIIASEGERGVMANLGRKSRQADKMFSALVEHMHRARGLSNEQTFKDKEIIPPWLSTHR